MGKRNGLSRRLDWKVGVKKNNENQILIKEQWIYSLTEVIIEGPKVDILEKIKIARSKNEEVVRVEKVYVPKDKELKVEIIWLYHNILIAKHCER